MRIDIPARGFDLTEGLREHTVRRLQFALSWASGEVREVRVCLSDPNGARGGNDKRCQIKIPIEGNQNLLVEDAQSDLYLAIDRAADRSGRAMARRLQRFREYRHDRPAAED